MEILLLLDSIRREGSPRLHLVSTMLAEEEVVVVLAVQVLSHLLLVPHLLLLLLVRRLQLLFSVLSEFL